MRELAANRKSWRREREFGWIVGGILILLSGWWTYRGKFQPLPKFTLPSGVLLVSLAFVFPRALKYPNRVWMGLAEVLSFISTRIVLTFVYFAIITPIGFSKRAFGWDPLHRRAGASDSYWQPYSGRQKDPRHYEKMY